MVLFQDGLAISQAERDKAEQQLPSLQECLRAELLAEGIDPDSGAHMVEDDSLHNAETIPEIGQASDLLTLGFFRAIHLRAPPPASNIAHQCHMHKRSMARRFVVRHSHPYRPLYNLPSADL